MLSFSKWFSEKIGLPLKWKYLVKYLCPYLKNKNKVLDLGASCGRLSSKLSNNLKYSNFVGVDTHVQPKTFIPIIEYDGKKIPYADNSFDCVMIVDVLHHDKNPEAVIKEAKRVSKKNILIKDHYWKNKIDFMLLKYADYIGNKRYGVSLPYNFLKISEWKSMFNRVNLKISKSEKFRYNFFDPCNHVIYLLEK